MIYAADMMEKALRGVRRCAGGIVAFIRAIFSSIRALRSPRNFRDRLRETGTTVDRGALATVGTLVFGMATTAVDRAFYQPFGSIYWNFLLGVLAVSLCWLTIVLLWVATFRRAEVGPGQPPSREGPGTSGATEALARATGERTAEEALEEIAEAKAKKGMGG